MHQSGAHAPFPALCDIGAQPSVSILGEFVPPGFGWIVKTFAVPALEFFPGLEKSETARASPGSWSRRTSVWEDALREEIIRRLHEATLLVNVSNVAWLRLARPGRPQATLPPPQKNLRQARARSRTPMLRAQPKYRSDCDHRSSRQVAPIAAVYRGYREGEVRGYAGASP